MAKLEYEIVETSNRSTPITGRLLKDKEEWISEPFCRYPQAIVIRFARLTEVSRIELLVHRKYIPSRMELYASNSKFSAIPPVHLFTSLGNITFKQKKSDNGRHELKTIFVETKAIFLKFSFGRNYNSLSNPKNQVGIVELNVFGGESEDMQWRNGTASTVSIYKPRAATALQRFNYPKTRKSNTSSSLSTSSIWRVSSRQSSLTSSRSKTPSKPNPAFVELKETLKRAEQAKLTAIEDENYAVAKSARRAEIQLGLILKQIRDLEREKQHAINDDDFDRAQELTNQIRTLRDNAFEQVDIKFLNSIPNDPRPSSSQFARPTMTGSTSASSILRQYQDGRLKIDSAPLLNVTTAPAFQLIPLTPSTINANVYPQPDQLPPKTPSSLASTTITFQSHKSANDELDDYYLTKYSKNQTPSLHSELTNSSLHSNNRPLNSTGLDQPAILPDSRLPNIRRLSDPTVYRSGNQEEKETTISSLSSKLSSIFTSGRKPTTTDLQSTHSNQSQNLDKLSTDTADKPRNKFLEKENQVVPGARKKKSTESVTLDALLDNMHPSERQLATQAIDFFGLKTISQVYSKNWEERRHGYLQIQQKLNNEPYSRNKSKDITRVVEFLIVRGLYDKLYNVYSVVLDLLKQLLSTYVVQNGLVESEGPRIVNSTYQLINRTGDTVNERRFAAGTFSAVSSLLHGDPRIANYYMTKFMQPFDSSHSMRTDQGKAKIVYDGLVELYISRIQALSVKNVCQFAFECLNHTDAKVRDYGRKMVIFLYERDDRQQVRAALPRGTAAKRIPAVKNLLDDLDVMDNQLKAVTSMISDLPRQTRFDSRPTIINGSNGSKKKHTKGDTSARSPARSRSGSRQNGQNMRLTVDKKTDDTEALGFNRQPKPESSSSNSLFSIPALRSILKNK